MPVKTQSEPLPGVDLHDDLFDAATALVRLTLLFHSGSPWNTTRRAQWDALQIPILRLQSAPARQLGGKAVEATTKGLCDLARAVLG